MHASDAALTAVLRTLVRATADARVPVVLRSHRPGQAEALARWLSAAHGSRRVVIASATARASITVRLPAHIAWPDCTEDLTGLARSVAGHHLSLMISHDPAGGER
jgi:hypothetical protein